MYNYAFAFLAFGHEHIMEFNATVKDLFKLDNNINIFVYTDDKSLIENKSVHIREEKLLFNFNLKRKAIAFAFEHHPIVVFMDTDVILTGKIDLNYPLMVDEGLYVRWSGDEVLYMNKPITIDEIIQTEYGKLLGNNLKFFNEFLMVIRIDDPYKRNEFINVWDELNDITLDCQPNNGNLGALECLIISAVCNRLNIPIIMSSTPFFRKILNAGSLKKIRKTTKSII